MKPIKDIGLEMWIEKNSDPESASLIHIKPERIISPWLPIHVIVMRPDDRRELVRRVWEDAINNADAVNGFDGFEIESGDVDNYIKEEGL